jgi:hypothetical protein
MAAMAFLFVAAGVRRRLALERRCARKGPVSKGFRAIGDQV